MSNGSFDWDWKYVCPTGLTPWMPDKNQLSPCFQQICLQFPVLVIFLVVSTFYFANEAILVRRNGTQICLIYLRCLVSFLFALIPFYDLQSKLSNQIRVWPIDILLAGTQLFTWMIHLAFLMASRNRGGLNHRGPLFIVVIWICVALLSAVWERTNLVLGISDSSVLKFVLHVIYGVTLLCNGQATFVTRRSIAEDERQRLIGNAYIRFQDDVQVMTLGAAQDDTPWLSRLIFFWVNPLIEKGLLGKLRNIDDLFDLPAVLNVDAIIERTQNAFDGVRSLLRALNRAFGWEFYSIGFLRFFGDISGFAGPLLLAALLNHKNDDKTGTDFEAYMYALGLFSMTLINAFSATHFNWRITLISLKMRIGLATTIYKKSLDAQFVNSDSPEVLNLMSTDTDRIVNSCISFHSFWSIPFQLFTTLYLLYTQIGIAFAAGVVFATILIPINRWLAKRIASYSTELLDAKDARVSQTFESLAGAKQIKILAWEDVFIDKIQKLRQREMKALSKRKYLDAMCVYFWATTPILINLLTFGTSTFLGQEMSAATTFASVALLNMLIGPLNAFPWVLNGLVEAWVSLKRVQKYLDLANVDFDRIYSPLEPDMSEPTEPEQTRRPIILSVKSATFAYNRTRVSFDDDDDEQDYVLKSVNCEVKKGQLVCLEGPVGGGKSAVFSALAGNMIRSSGHVHIDDAAGGFGYVPQTIWLQHGTIRENILWGELFDEERYKRVLHSCALVKDIEELCGDDFDIGEGGCTLSGGQRARVALARAVYQNKEIYLIDDVLAALDAHVANHIVKHCILGFLKDKTRIVATSNRMLFFYANQILHVENGVVSQSDYALGSFESDYEEESIEDLSQPFSFELNEHLSSRAKQDTNEQRETGSLSASVLATYWTAWGSGLAVVVFLSIVLMQASKNFSDAWLAHWIAEISPSNSTNEVKLNPKLLGSKYYMQEIKRNILCMFQRMAIFKDINVCSVSQNGLVNETFAISFYLLIYFLIAVFNSTATFVRAFSFAFAGIKAAKLLHTKLLNSVFYTEFSFFDLAPLGRILNRFSSDTYTIDDSLPFILNILLAQLLGLIGSICISMYGMPWLALLIVPMTPIYLVLQWRYRHSSRDIKRLASNSLSPIYTHFTETINGLATIRAMRANNRFHRDFTAKLEENIRAQLSSSAAQQWLGLRLQLLGAVLVGGSGFVAVITSAHSTSPEMVGLVISYSLSVTGLLTGVLNALTETEQELVAVERVHNYCNLQPEKNADGSQDPPFGWPFQGVVKFDHVTMKYRDYLRPAIYEMNFQTSPCERVGIIGRTGAGKSSIMATLIRIAPVTSGRVTIDTVDISTLPLNVLRSRLAVVPQDPFLFAGTIRDNMDPRNLHLDSDIWNAIHKCLATPFVQNLGGLSAYLDSRGSNISAGQKQLLCLARAMLRKSKVVVIDEGTSNLDPDSENAIQLVLRNSFKSSTVLLIAHRLNGLQQTDRILVIEGGKIVEEGKPSQLLNDPESRYSSMLEEQDNHISRRRNSIASQEE